LPLARQCRRRRRSWPRLAGSLLIPSGYYRWIAAVARGAFTLVATFVGKSLLGIPLPDRFGARTRFFEPWGLVALSAVSFWTCVERILSTEGHMSI